jgi:hypothetical protein
MPPGAKRNGPSYRQVASSHAGSPPEPRSLRRNWKLFEPLAAQEARPIRPAGWRFSAGRTSGLRRAIATVAGQRALAGLRRRARAVFRRRGYQAADFEDEPKDILRALADTIRSVRSGTRSGVAVSAVAAHVAGVRGSRSRVRLRHVYSFPTRRQGRGALRHGGGGPRRRGVGLTP